ncbi:MAG: nucleotide exchange factor GrpE [Clostridia bacterium]|nr:nucleotide exchange factor GrpE [Clostridia bacterium]
MNDKQNNTNDDCKCSAECTCGDDCNCTEENKCNPNCTCGEHNKGKHHHKHKSGEKCDCHGKDDCNCHDNECDCEDCHPKTAEEALKMYEQAFNKYEEVLTKLDADLEKEKKRADENEHIARCFRQDLERYKERTKNIEADAQISANINTATKLLPILDNFNSAITSAQDEQIKKGFSMIYSGLEDVIKGLGLEEIEAQGAEFNPEFHNCVNKVKAEKGQKEGTISKVYQKGYKMAGENGKVVRHAVVEIYE